MINVTEMSIIIPNEIVFDEVRNCISRGESVTINLEGHSMEPLLKSGDKVTLIPVYSRNEINRGDVVLFCFSGQWILHRVIKIDNNRYILKGDALCSTEVAVYEDIIAKMSSVEKSDGMIIYNDSLKWKLLSFRVLVLKLVRYSFVGRGFHHLYKILRSEKKPK